MDEAVVAVLLGIQNPVLDEDGDGPQDEGHKQVHVNEVPGAVQLPAHRSNNKNDKNDNKQDWDDHVKGNGKQLSSQDMSYVKVIRIISMQ